MTAYTNRSIPRQCFFDTNYLWASEVFKNQSFKSQCIFIFTLTRIIKSTHRSKYVVVQRTKKCLSLVTYAKSNLWPLNFSPTLAKNQKKCQTLFASKAKQTQNLWKNWTKLYWSDLLIQKLLRMETLQCINLTTVSRGCTNTSCRLPEVYCKFVLKFKLSTLGPCFRNSKF